MTYWNIHIQVYTYIFFLSVSKVFVFKVQAAIKVEWGGGKALMARSLKKEL